MKQWFSYPIGTPRRAGATAARTLTKYIILLILLLALTIPGVPSAEAAEGAASLTTASWSTNLVTNPGAETGNLSGWTTIASGGDGWSTSTSPHQGTRSFITSYGWDTRSQEIDLLAVGFSASYLDGAPDVMVGEWFKGFDCGGGCNAADKYYIKVELRNASHGIIQTWNVGTQAAPITATASWTEQMHTFGGYGTGLRYIYLEDGGMSAEYWAGQYGAMMDDAYVMLAPTILYVNSTGTGNCTNWANACKLQTALINAVGGNEIWVKEGVYKPGTLRTDTFQLKNGVSVYGGFFGDETALANRHGGASILSGDIDNNDDQRPIITNIATETKNTSNSYQVVKGASNATLDGFTITAGNANGASPNNAGGGMYNSSSSPTVTNVNFSGNKAGSGGGGMYNSSGSNPKVMNVTFSSNQAPTGGGVANSGASGAPNTSKFTNVTFENNLATATDGTYGGGGMYNWNGSPSLQNVTFFGNKANSSSGGALMNEWSSPTLTNVTFANNTASSKGGGMMNNNASNPKIYNTILWGNTASTGAQIHNNTGTGIQASTPTITDSVVYGGYGGGTNIFTTDPKLGTELFSYPGYPPVIQLNMGSSAINTGNVTYCTLEKDQRGQSYIGTCDIGAYEYDGYKGKFYVEPGATGNCQGWGTDACSLTEALSLAASGDEIWVKEGVYKPGTLRADTFQLKNGVKVYGGFFGDETVLASRHGGDSILSGDIDGNDSQQPIITNIITVTNNTSNSYHVVKGATNATLDGFTITAGNANGSDPDIFGGGMYNYGVSPTVENVTFSGNAANQDGGGMFNYASSPIVKNVTFNSNLANFGGGMYNRNTSSPTVTNVTFNLNKANTNGGGMYNYDSSSPTLKNVLIANSTSGGDCVNSSSTLNGASANNLIKDASNACGLTNGTGGNIIGSDPKLGILGSNGGFTQTIPLLPGSPAINKGANCAAGGKDQRGVSYVGVCDIGAFEYKSDGTTYYVKPAASGAANCESWDNACTLQVALVNVASGQIWVKEGVYKPGTLRTDTFQLKNGVSVYGGFFGDETALANRHGGASILSGDIDGNDTQTPIITNLSTVTGNITNSYHVVKGATGAMLDGFIITAGYANGSSSDSNGGGMYNSGSNPTVTNVTFSGNRASNYGGGMYNISASNPSVTNVTFIGNSAGYGGGMYNEAGSPSVTNVTFSGNSATSGGGGMYNKSSSSPTLKNVLIANSTSGGDCVNSSSTLNANSINNLIEDSSNACGLTDGDSKGSKIGTDPQLGALGSYGGSTQTIPLMPGSRAINGASTNCTGTDQRGVARSTTTCDIGAFEYNFGTAYYVKPSASGAANCENWANACTLQVALTNVLSGQVWVQEGVYKPTTTTDRTATFQLKNGVSVYGGFFGDETVLGSRHGGASILSGDLLGNDSGFTNNGDNSYHVVTGATGPTATTLDGFTITAGNANGTAPDNSGGGMYNNGVTTLAVTNVTISGNAAVNGGGMFNTASSPIVTNVTFSGNKATNGGGMYNTTGSNPLVTTTNPASIAFSNNSATTSGGGMYNEASSPTVTNLTFNGNSAANGGGMYNNASSPTVEKVTFDINTATSGNGGGMYNTASSPTVTNVTFSGNKAGYGGGMYNTTGSNPLVTTNVTFSNNEATADGGGMYNSSSNPTVKNDVTFSGNSAANGGGMYNNASSPTVEKVTFDINTATSGNGGGMFNYGSSPTITKVIFSGNKATSGSGGGMYNISSSNPKITKVTFSGNEAANGGGIHNNNASSSLEVTNVTFSGNKATANGGGMYNNASSPAVTHATFSGNQAPASGGGGMYNSASSNPAIRSSILWGDTGGEIINSSSTPTVSYSVVQSGYAGGTNIVTSDPKLDTLKNDGGFTPTIPLKLGSSAIDAADPSDCPVDGTDQRGVSYVDVCDIGAYEYSSGSAPYTGTYYVRQVASGDKNCQSWADACVLADAISMAPANVTLWVAEGTYKPGADQFATFQLKSGMKLYGGFPATGNPVEGDRDPAANPTILSGDIGTPGTKTDNSYHVVKGADGVTLDGFTIKDGYANGTAPDNAGGGMYNNNVTNLTITNVWFSGNSADANGGGLYNNNVTGLTLTNVTFSTNSAANGGGMYNASSSPTVANVTFSGNTATNGGGIYNTASSPAVTNVTFSGNSAATNGGGIANFSTSSPTLKNVILWGNTAANGGAQVYIEDTACAPVISDSVIQGGYPGGTNIITSDPLLGGNLEFYFGDTPTLPLMPGSSAIDAGNDTVSICDADLTNNFDQRGVARPQDGNGDETSQCDIGAYEYEPNQEALIYENFVLLEQAARAKLKASLDVRLSISPYRGGNSFDTIVANFNTNSGWGQTLDGKTLAERIAQADQDLSEARDLYGYLAVYAKESNFRGDTRYTVTEPAGFDEPLCGVTSKEAPNPSGTNGQVLDPVVDWCDFKARLRQSVRESAYLHMIFAQQFMTDALGSQFSSGLIGADDIVKKEMSVLNAATLQYTLAEKGLNEALGKQLGNGCYVSDYFTQFEWSLFSRAMEGRETAQYQIAVRNSYFGITETAAGPQQKRTESVNELRTASLDGYIKFIGIASLSAGQPSGSGCAVLGERPDGALAVEMARNLAQTRIKAGEMTAGRNIFGFDVSFTPAFSYSNGETLCNQDGGLYQRAMCAVKIAETSQAAVENAQLHYDTLQADLLTAVKAIKAGIDGEINDVSGCTMTGDWQACVDEQKAKLNQCLAYVTVYPPISGQDFDACMGAIGGGTAKQTLLDLRNIYIQQYSILQKVKDIDARIKLSNDANTLVKSALTTKGNWQTAADASSAALDMVSCFEPDNALAIGEVLKNWGCGVVGAINVGLQINAGIQSTIADVTVEDAANNKEVQNMLLDQQELLIDAYGVSQQFASKYSEFETLMGNLDDNVLEAQRQRFYVENSPANDPSFRIVRDSYRLQFAENLSLAARLTYLAARRAEYEYGTRLNESNIRFSDIYRARTAGDLESFLNKLITVSGFSAPSQNAQDLTYSVAKNWLHLTDAVLTSAGFTTPETIQAERTRRFREWVAQNTVMVDGKPALKFALSTSLLDGGSFAQLFPNNYSSRWLLTLSGIDAPHNGFSVNLVSDQTGLGKRDIDVIQGGTVHLRSQMGCIFDYRLIAPSAMLDLDWPPNLDPGSVAVSFLANVNGETSYSTNGLRTAAFQGRPVSATNWDIVIYSAAPNGASGMMELQQLKDIELNFSINYASGASTTVPAPSACTRIDW